MDADSVISVSDPLHKYEIRTLIHIRADIRLAGDQWILRYPWTTFIKKIK